MHNGYKERSGLSGCLVSVLLLLLGGSALFGLHFLFQTEEGLQIVKDFLRIDQIRAASVVTTEEDLKDCYFYEQLTKEKEKQIYKEIYEGLKEREDEIIVSTDNAYEANDVFLCVFWDHPEIFWCDGDVRSTAYPEVLKQEAYVALNPGYNCEKEKIAARKSEIQNSVQEIKARLRAADGDYEKIKAVYDYLIDTVDYVENSSDNQNIYSSLVNHKTVCAGYARGAQYLLETEGIFCTYVTGTVTDPEGKTSDHAWNIVRCDGKHYYFDATWGDPIFQQEEAAEGVAKTYDYLCCSERELMKTHTLDKKYEFPACDAEDLNYYKLNHLYYESFDPDAILKAMRKDIDAKNDYTVLKFSSDEAYDASVNAVVNDLIVQGARYLGAQYGLSEISYSYEENVVLNKVVCYWIYE